MNVLITGGTGLIGKKLISVLKQHKANITVLTRNIKKASTLVGTDIVFIEKLSVASIENQEVVINLAGEPIANKPWSNTQKKKICNSRWSTTKQLTELINASANPPFLFISGSAIGIYGRQDNRSIDESFTQYHQEFTWEVCKKWEDIALEVNSAHTRVAILRTGIVLDSEAGALAKMLLPFKLGLGGRVGTGQQVMSWIHIDDMISAVLHIQNTAELSGVINLTAEYPVTNTIFSQQLAATLKRPCLLPIPAIALKIILGEMADLLLFGQKVLPSKLINSGFRFSYPTIDKALKNLFGK
ncbi:TIGR01777 family oxidoreductase [Colwellia sp. E2M01]|uniref:TIGR01777 family oxidoreductase n=1 Tax=Colwellia sp. E2M01 TaxID=2841561 RepID=UPI001C09DCB7|nr:TIGR01777 family oxidoreductase [Colwellia sp. E2M01]MBU2870393.1 TIGR01777 family oxidoreductase [Colwellia sp. E2M01]